MSTTAIATYAWIISADYIDAGRVGVMGPHNAPEELIGRLEKGEGKRFTMYDDDGEPYYSGRIIGEFEGLEPLDDFGTADAGATEIRINGVLI